MRIALTPAARFVSITLLATLAACSGSQAQPDGGDDTGPATDAIADRVVTDTTPGLDVLADTPGDSQQPQPDVVTQPDVVRMDVATDTGGGTDGGMMGDGGFTPGTCGISSEVGTYVSTLNTTGWAALNRSRSLMMYGCAGAARPQDCLASLPLASATDIGANRSAIASAHLRLLYTATNRSSYWTRSSADGRFIARGTHVHDMVRGVEVEAAGAMYDPAFFPDNSGFMYQPGGRMCPMSALTTNTTMTVAITGTGSACASSSVGLYEHLGASLEGGDYWATAAGTAAWDDGGHMATLTETRRNEAWTATASTTLTLMANTGAGFSAVGSRNVTTPLQGDAVISPSSRSMITRFVDDAGTYQGYVLHRLEATHSGAAITATTHEMARYCTVGAKPAFSYDERYVIYHHYVGGGPAADADARDMGFTGSADAGFANYRTQGAANIYIIDLQTGVRTRLTNMGPGQYALYPHFRNDGWVYFLVRTLGSTTEHMIASDAVLLMP